PARRSTHSGSPSALCPLPRKLVDTIVTIGTLAAIAALGTEGPAESAGDGDVKQGGLCAGWIAAKAGWAVRTISYAGTRRWWAQPTLRRCRKQDGLQHADIGRLDQVVIEAGRLRPAAVFFLTPSGEGDEHHPTQVGPLMDPL